jgi:hypothetical protein
MEPEPIAIDPETRQTYVLVRKEEKARRKALAKTGRLRQNDPATTPSREDS